MKCASYPNLALFTLLISMNAFPMFNSICPCHCPCLILSVIFLSYLFISYLIPTCVLF
jgi:hypothetical protein